MLTLPRAPFILAAAMLVLAGCGQNIDTDMEISNQPTEASYVGDEACASCHEDLYLSYHRTGMGKSVSRFDADSAPEQFSEGIEVFHDRTGYYYTPFIRNDTLFQKEYKKDNNGQITFERTHPVEWVVGSGNATRSYFMSVNGYVTQMPLTWYVESGKWDLSPAYEQNNHRYSRPIGPQCMTCHNGLPEHTLYTNNHYSEVPLGITCERCHGPGSEHVDLRLAGLDPPDTVIDSSIVNPAHLDRPHQLSICQQCHLTGTTVFRPGEDMTTYSPGELLSANRTIYVTEDQLTDPERFGIASHASRLSRSACYEQSAMTCITCHDPHVPVNELEDDYFNRVCQSCHSPGTESPHNTACSRDGASLAELNQQGNCVSCHLQKSGTSDIPHVTFTDHWIRRTLPPAKAPDEINRELVKAEAITLVAIESDQAGQTPQSLLEQAIAYFEFYDSQHQLPDYLAFIVQSARQGLAQGAEHPEGRLSLGRALMEMDSLEAALSTLETAVELFPNHARLHYWLGIAQQSKDLLEPALLSFKTAVEVAPAFNEARIKMADVLSSLSRTAESESAYLEVLRRDSVHLPEAWNNLGFLYLLNNRTQDALPLFQRATALDPNLVLAWANAGSVHLYHGELEEAAFTLEKALAIDDSSIPVLGNLAQTYWQMNRQNEARSMLQRLLMLQPNDQRARALLEQWQ